MELLAVALVVGGTFGLCYLVDKGFTKVFRGKAQHKTGLSVRLSKKYGLFGVLLTVLGICAMIASLEDTMVLTIGGAIVLVMGICLIVYYLTFGIFYDKECFILTTFGKKSVTYRHSDIRSQQLYNAYGNIVIELHMADGRAVSLQSAMEGVYPFLDTAFAAWCRQKGMQEGDCAFHDPDNSCWFPSMEEV